MASASGVIEEQNAIFEHSFIIFMSKVQLSSADAVHSPRFFILQALGQAQKGCRDNQSCFATCVMVIMLDRLYISFDVFAKIIVCLLYVLSCCLIHSIGLLVIIKVLK